MAGEAFFFDFFLGAIDGGLLPARAIMRIRLYSARSELPHNDVRPRPHGGILYSGATSSVRIESKDQPDDVPKKMLA